MKKSELISIIVPVYNVKDYVEKCFESLMGQTYQNIEILVIDDGSTDGSEKICDLYEKKDKRVRAYHKRNGGLSDARNYGIKKARGKYVALVDSDDYVEPDYVEKMYEEILKSDADIVVCGYNGARPVKEVLTGESATVRLLVLQENLDVVAWNKLYRKELFVKNNIWYPDGMKHEDALTTYKLFSKAGRVSYIDRELYHYVVRETSIMGQAKVEDRLRIRELAACEAIEYLQANKELKQAGEIALLTSKFAYIDASIRGEISESYYDEARGWIIRNAKKYSKNQYMYNRLKLYLKLIVFSDGWLYKMFRKIKK